MATASRSPSRPSRRRAGITLLILLLIGLSPVFAHAWVLPVEFNQFLLHRVELRNGVLGRSDAWSLVSSAYSSGLDILRRWPSRTPPDRDDPEAMFEYVFSWIPPRAVVYPTEGFYYFRFTCEDDVEVGGNVRIADLDRGQVCFVYYEMAKPEHSPTTFYVTEEHGLEVLKESDYRYRVSYGGKTVEFRMPVPEPLLPSEAQLLPVEEYVGWIHDESGIKFHLIFNHETNSFYKLLDERGGVADTLESLDERFLIGTRTGFVFYDDPDYDRRLLMGVNLESVKRNDYFDGPADQVPFRANLRGKLHVAYPNTMLGDGIDEHGVYVNKVPWVRIAVSPYHRYSSVHEVLERWDTCGSTEDKSELWTSLTKEWWNRDPWLSGVKKKLREEGKVVPGEEDATLAGPFSASDAPPLQGG